VKSVFLQLSWNDRLIFSSLCSGLRQLFVKNTTLLALDGREHGRALSSESIRVLLGSFRHIAQLEISNCNFVTDNAIQYMVSHGLTRLKLVNCKNITILALKSLVQITSLRELHLDGAFQVGTPVVSCLRKIESSHHCLAVPQRTRRCSCSTWATHVGDIL
jgi:hypothetical protein